MMKRKFSVHAKTPYMIAAVMLLASSDELLLVSPDELLLASPDGLCLASPEARHSEAVSAITKRNL